MATISSGSVTVTIQPGEQYRVIATGEAYVDIGGGSTQSYRLINGASEKVLGGFIVATPVTIRVISGGVEYINVSGTGDSVALSLAQSSRTDISGVVASTASNTASMPDGSTRDLMAARQKAQLLKNNTSTIVCPTNATTNLKQVCGAAGDIITSVEVVITATPLSAPVRLKDGNNTSYDILPSGSPVGTSVVALNRKSLSGGWQAIIPTNATANITGEFQ